MIARTRSADDEFLRGATAIANYTGLARTMVYDLVNEPDNGFPAYKVKNIIIARKKALQDWQRRLEREAMGGTRSAHP